MTARETEVAAAIAKENARIAREGGQAFPLQNSQFTEAYGGAPGMTKREYFASQFMRNIMQMNDHNINEHQAAVAARFACMAADALIAELAK